MYSIGQLLNDLILLLLKFSGDRKLTYCVYHWQLLPLYVMDRMNYPGFPGLFTACVFSGALR